MPEPLQRLQVSGLVPGGTPAPPKIGNCDFLVVNMGRITFDLKKILRYFREEV